MAALMKQVVMSGVTGYLGGHLYAELHRQSIDVVPLVRSREQLDLFPNALLIESDEALVAAVVGVAPDAVVHVAATGGVASGVVDFSAMIRSNITLGALLMQASAELQATTDTTFVGIGSFSQQSINAGVVSPNSFYAATKDALESFALFYHARFGLQSSFLLPTDIYGPGDQRRRLLALLAQAAISSEPIAVTAGEQQVSFVHVLDVSDAVTHVLQSKQSTGGVERFGVHGPEVGTLRHIVEHIERSLNLTIPARWGERPYRDNEVMQPALLGHPPGWRPKRSVVDGFRELVEELT